MYVLQTILPDGPHWYAGVRQVVKNGKLIQGPEWSPYWEDRKEMSNLEAGICMTSVCKGVDGIQLLLASEALYKDTWKHLGGNEVMMRAKYLQKGMKILRTGVFYIVRNINKTHIVTYPESVCKGGKANGGVPQKIGKKSDEWINVIFEKKKEVAA